MEAGFSQAQAQRVLKQRNMLVMGSAGLAIVTIFSLIAASERDRAIVLQPVLTRQLELSSAGVSREYLELVTRDAAVMMLNRSPQNLDYWMDSVLKIVHPSAYGRSEEHTSELQSLMRISYAVFCLKKKKITRQQIHIIKQSEAAASETRDLN